MYDGYSMRLWKVRVVTRAKVKDEVFGNSAL